MLECTLASVYLLTVSVLLFSAIPSTCLTLMTFLKEYYILFWSNLQAAAVFKAFLILWSSSVIQVCGWKDDDSWLGSALRLAQKQTLHDFLQIRTISICSHLFKFSSILPFTLFCFLFRVAGEGAIPALIGWEAGCTGRQPVNPTYLHKVKEQNKTQGLLTTYGYLAPSCGRWNEHNFWNMRSVLCQKVTVCQKKVII